MGREALRREFQPRELRILFIGESAPASGRFFYQADSGLYRAMRDAFQDVDPSVNDTNFLEVFHSLGCYLVDLCPHPVDGLDRKSRRETCRASEGSLAKKILQLQPPVIVSLLRSIEGNVMRAVSCAGWRGTLINVPYPGRWAHHRQAFREACASLLGGVLYGSTISSLADALYIDPVGRTIPGRGFPKSLSESTK